MEEFKSNSHKSREANDIPEKKVEKAIAGQAKVKKKSEIRKFTDIFMAEDVNSVKSYIVMDVLVPSLKKAISDIVTNGIDMILYGGSGGNSSKSTASKVSYRSYYDRQGNNRETRPLARTRSTYDYDDIVLDSRGEAEDVLARMDELLDKYRMVSVADLYDLVGVTCNYTDNKYGWTDLHAASVVRVRDGYLIKLPRALPLD